MLCKDPYLRFSTKCWEGLWLAGGWRVWAPTPTDMIILPAGLSDGDNAAID